jgi:A/G-specific adenine glycosylase
MLANLREAVRRFSAMPDTMPQLPSAEWTRKFRRRLLTWYCKSKRDLPWRNTADPYAIWVSEIMLQQTQVVTVIPYYERFLRAWPDVMALADADESEVLRLWEGLGYYRRARQMHAAAKAICEQHEGVFPVDFNEVLALPGIGRYTAGAITSFAYGHRQPALEANTIRLFTRLLAYEGDPAKATGQDLLWKAAAHVLPRKRVAELNQALMELGSLVCQPTRPECPCCPVIDLCAAHARGIVDQIPLKAQKMKYEDRKEAAVVIRNRGRVLLRKCQDGERWAGLWDFPRFHLTQPAGVRQRRELQQHLRNLTGQMVQIGTRLTTIQHGVTRFRIELDCYEAHFEMQPPRLSAPLKWILLSRLLGYPLSVTGRRIERLLTEQENG